MVKKLFHIQDSDRPVYVVANSFTQALAKWQVLRGIENPEMTQPSSEYPTGIVFVANNDELIL